MNKFLFFELEPGIINNLDKKIIQIPRNIREKNELFDFFSEKLNFPYYFGKNWDALNDFLTDLSWIKENTIVVIHYDIPFRFNEKEQKIYIQLLSHLFSSGEINEIHKLYIYFPKLLKNEIETLLL